MSRTPEQEKIYRTTHREQYRLSNKRYRDSHKEKAKAYKSKYRIKHKEELQMKRSEYYQANKEKKSAYHRNYYQEKRKLVFDHYGWMCLCCGETEPAFLTVDHINGDGAEHKRKRGTTLYEWLVKNNFPEGFRTLCYNCNCGRKLGVCPHETQTYLDRIGW